MIDEETKSEKLVGNLLQSRLKGWETRFLDVASARSLLFALEDMLWAQQCGLESFWLEQIQMVVQKYLLSWVLKDTDRSLWQTDRREWNEQRHGEKEVQRLFKESKRSLIWWPCGKQWEGKWRGWCLGGSRAESSGDNSCIELGPGQNSSSLVWFPLENKLWISPKFTFWFCVRASLSGSLHSPLAISYLCPQVRQTLPS